MILPEKIVCRPIGFMDGANGYKVQEFENRKFGLKIRKIKENRNSEWKQEITIQALPNQVFETMKELRRALEDKNILNFPKEDVVNLNKGIAGLAKQILADRKKRRK